jgi:3-oxoacyl-[acyl-carrier protein] reductase
VKELGLLDGKRIAITGASRGLGRAFALAVAAEGASVVINGTNAELLQAVEKSIWDAGGEAISVLGSVADDDVGAAIVGKCVDTYGGLDVLINNAGIVRDRTLMKMSPEEFDDVIAVNLRGTWSASRHAARAMRESGGMLLQVISNAAIDGSVGQTNYAASKAGVLGMLYAWDVELQRFGIRTNAIWPVAQTDMTQGYLDQQTALAASSGLPTPTFESLGLGQPDAVATIVVYLCSDQASDIRSQVFTFSGSKLAIWQHPTEIVIDRRPSWTVADLAEAIGDKRSPVHISEF